MILYSSDREIMICSFITPSAGRYLGRKESCILMLKV